MFRLLGYLGPGHYTSRRALPAQRGQAEAGQSTVNWHLFGGLDLLSNYTNLSRTMSTVDSSWSSMLSNRAAYNMNQKHKRSLSERSFPLLKRPKLFSSLRGLMHRKTRSVASIRTSKSAGETSSTTYSPTSPRSRSLDSAKKPLRFKQRRGHTPNLDDYLTLSQLENVWQTQDVYLGCYDAPQRTTNYSYTDPVEAPTVTKHQVHLEVVRPATPPRAHELGGTKAQGRPTIHHRRSSQGSVRPPSPLRPRKPGLQLKTQGDLLPPPTPSQHGAPRSSTSMQSPHQRTTSSPFTNPNPSPRPSTSPLADVRNAVVSGIIHPALRSDPYFDFKQPPSNCRTAQGLGLDMSPNHWVYGKI